MMMRLQWLFSVATLLVAVDVIIDQRTFESNHHPKRRRNNRNAFIIVSHSLRTGSSPPLQFVARRIQQQQQQQYRRDRSRSLFSTEQKVENVGTTMESINNSNINNNIQWNELDKKLQRCTSGTQARNVLEQELLVRNHSDINPIPPTKQQRQHSLYKSIRIPADASIKGLSDGDLAIQTRLINSKYKIMDVIDLVGDSDSDRATIGIGVTFMMSTGIAIAINQSPFFNMGPDIVRFVLVLFFVFAPLGVIGYGIRDAEALQRLLQSIQQQIDPIYRQRIIQHEAGHFLMGHLLGWPIRGYTLQTTNIASAAVQLYELSDPDVGKSLAQQLGFDRKSKSRIDDEEKDVVDLQDRIAVALSNAPYYSESGRGASVVEQQSTFRNRTRSAGSIYGSRIRDARNDPTTVWPYRGLPEDTLDMLTMISVGGVCSEILAMGNANGGRADFDQLRQLLSLSSSSDKEAQGAMTDREMNNRLRYALGFTMSVLRRHLHQLDALSEVMEQNGSITQCIKAIETATTKINLSMGERSDEYELSRRERFRSQGVAGRLRVLLGDGMLKNERSVDTIEDRLEQGKGGGSRKQVYRLTGDDPLYIAITVAGLFLLWAASGGLSLH